MREKAATVACIADIHGVVPALEAVLRHPEVENADLIVVCGDIAAGPQPTQVLDRLSALSNVRLVRGNADRELVAIARGDVEVINSAIGIDLWAATQLSEQHLKILDSLPYPLQVDVDGFGTVTFCHGTPRSDEEVVLVDTRLSRWAEVLAGFTGANRTLVCGHTHMPFLRLINGVTVVNPGSVGMPYGQPGAHWALLKDGGVYLHREEYDYRAAIDEISSSSGFPGARDWAQEYVLAANSDLDAMRAFGPRDGR